MTDTHPTPETDPKRGADDHLAARIAAATERAAAQYGAAGREAAERNVADQMAAARAEAERIAAEHEAIAHIKEAMHATLPEPEPEPASEPESAPVEPPTVAPPVVEPPAAVTLPAAAPITPPPPPVVKRTGTPVWLTVLIALLLCGGIYYVWQDKPQPTLAATPASGVDGQRVAALEAALKAAQDHITALENRPAPPASAPGTAAEASRLVVLETALRELQAKPQAATPDTSALEARLATLEKRQPPDVDSLVANASAALTAKIAALDAQVQKDVALTTARAAAAAKLRGANAALESGKPLGAIADAPPALARFATAAPPTEPALRLSFAKFADLAETASKPSPEGHDFAERMWMRAQSLVTVRQGDHVLLGAPAAVTLEAARGKLDAGDLAGAVAALAPLDQAATAAMKPWRDDAQALLDARSALAALAAKS